MDKWMHNQMPDHLSLIISVCSFVSFKIYGVQLPSNISKLDGYQVKQVWPVHRPTKSKVASLLEHN